MVELTNALNKTHNSYYSSIYSTFLSADYLLVGQVFCWFETLNGTLDLWVSIPRSVDASPHSTKSTSTYTVYVQAHVRIRS